MQDLKKLIQLINSKESNHILLFENQVHKCPKELLLLRSVSSHAFQNDHHVAKLLYLSTPNDARYTTLKSRLKEKLLNYLLFITLTGESNKPDTKPENRCEKQLQQARILIRQEEYEMGEQLLKKLFRTAKEYEFTALIVACLELLLEVYIKTGAVACFRQTREMLLSYREILAGEHTAQWLYQEAQLPLLTEKTQEELLGVLSSTTLQLQQLWQKSGSFACFDLYYRLHVQQLEMEGKYEQLLVLTTLSNEFLRDLKINKKRFDYQHNHALRIHCCLRTGDIVSGLQLAQEGKLIIQPDSPKWLRYQESYFLLAMHARDYHLAKKIINEVKQQLSFTKALALVQEKWCLYKLYLNLVHPGEAKNFILETEFMRDVMPLLYKEKQGYNVAILILHFCHCLYHNHTAFLSSKEEVYRKYIDRYFGSDLLDRERLFFLLMLTVIRHNFEHKQVIKKTDKLLKQLKQCSLPGGARISPIEIVPYEHVWRSITGMLSSMNATKSDKQKITAVPAD